MRDEEIEFKARIAGITKSLLVSVLAYYCDRAGIFWWSASFRYRGSSFTESAFDRSDTSDRFSFRVNSFSCPFCKAWKTKRNGFEGHLETHEYSDLLMGAMSFHEEARCPPDDKTKLNLQTLEAIDLFKIFKMNLG